MSEVEPIYRLSGILKVNIGNDFSMRGCLYCSDRKRYRYSAKLYAFLPEVPFYRCIIYHNIFIYCMTLKSVFRCFSTSN